MMWGWILFSITSGFGYLSYRYRDEFSDLYRLWTHLRQTYPDERVLQTLQRVRAFLQAVHEPRHSPYVQPLGLLSFHVEYRLGGKQYIALLPRCSGVCPIISATAMGEDGLIDVTSEFTAWYGPNYDWHGAQMVTPRMLGWRWPLHLRLFWSDEVVVVEPDENLAQRNFNLPPISP